MSHDVLPHWINVRTLKTQYHNILITCRHGLTNPQDEQTSLRDLLAMEEVLLTGVRALDNASQLVFVQRCVNPEHWAGSAKRKATSMTGENGEISDHRTSKKSTKASTAKAIVTASRTSENITAPATSVSATASTSVGSNTTAPGSFRILVPGENGAKDANFLRGITFVITGTFPEAGGGGESDAGVANVTAMISSFGGKVNTRYSKTTSEFTIPCLSSLNFHQKPKILSVLYTM